MEDEFYQDGVVFDMFLLRDSRSLLGQVRTKFNPTTVVYCASASC